MKPYFQDDAVTIYHGDCREILPSLTKVDLVLTDPPYGINYSTGYRLGVYRPSTRITADLLESPILNDVAAMVDKILNDVAAIYIFAAPERLDVIIPLIKAHWDCSGLLVWDKGNCAAGDLDTTWGQQWEAIIYARKGKPTIQPRDRDVLRFNRMNGCDYVHPTQKPVELFSYIINHHKNGLILDPFMGSGTTLRAAKNLGRKAIGIEIEEKYCEIAAKRMAQTVMELNV